jgi:hypothetical protein
MLQEWLTVREVAAPVSKTEAGRLRLRALSEGLLPARQGDDRVQFEWSRYGVVGDD